MDLRVGDAEHGSEEADMLGEGVVLASVSSVSVEGPVDEIDMRILHIRQLVVVSDRAIYGRPRSDATQG